MMVICTDCGGLRVTWHTGSGNLIHQSAQLVIAELPSTYMAAWRWPFWHTGRVLELGGWRWTSSKRRRGASTIAGRFFIVVTVMTYEYTANMYRAKIVVLIHGLFVDIYTRKSRLCAVYQRARQLTMDAVRH